MYGTRTVVATILRETRQLHHRHSHTRQTQSAHTSCQSIRLRPQEDNQCDRRWNNTNTHHKPHVNQSTRPKSKELIHPPMPRAHTTRVSRSTNPIKTKLSTLAKLQLKSTHLDTICSLDSIKHFSHLLVCKIRFLLQQHELASAEFLD